jgi:hypothetical protein
MLRASKSDGALAGWLKEGKSNRNKMWRSGSTGTDRLEDSDW